MFVTKHEYPATGPAAARWQHWSCHPAPIQLVMMEGPSRKLPQDLQDRIHLMMHVLREHGERLPNRCHVSLHSHDSALQHAQTLHKLRRGHASTVSSWTRATTPGATLTVLELEHGMLRG